MSNGDDFGRSDDPEKEALYQEFRTRMQREYADEQAKHQQGVGFTQYLEQRFRDRHPDLAKPALDSTILGEANIYAKEVALPIRSLEEADTHIDAVATRVRKKLSAIHGKDPEQEEAFQERQEEYRKARQFPK